MQNHQIKMSRPEKTAAINWFSGQSDEIQIEVIGTHTNLIRQNKMPGQPITAELSRDLLAQAARATRIDQNALAFKRDLTVAQTEEISRKRIEAGKKPRRKKGSKKLDRIRKEFFALICLLHEMHNYSFSEIVRFLREHHQFDTSKSGLISAYKQLKREVNHG